MMDITAEDVVKRAIKKGCDAAEVFVRHSKGISVEAKGGNVDALEASKDFGVAMRVIKNRRLGFAFTTRPAEIEQTIDEAAAVSEWTAVDEYNDIPCFLQPLDVMVYDENIVNLPEEDIIRDALLLESSALSYDERIKKVRKAGVTAGEDRTEIVNSNGVNISYDSTYYSAYVTAFANDAGGDSQVGWDFAGSRRISDIDIKLVGENASRRALQLLGSRKITPVKLPVILNPAVAVDFLKILSASLSAESVQKQRSFLAGRTGQDIISPVIDIVDDGAMEWRIGTTPVDDEGVSTGRKSLVEKGVLKSFMHNTYTARKDGVISTGNAVRSNARSLPGVGATNLYIDSKSGMTCRDLVKSLKKGILITSAMGVHMANPVSGDFSIGISGIWIENGESLYPVKEAVVSGNILEMFRKTETVGNDLVFYGRIGSPSLLIGDMDVSA